MNNSIFYTDVEKGLSPQGTVPEIEDSEMNKYTAGIIIGLLGAGLTIEAQADPLIYEYNLQGPSTIESESIKTSGTIKTISASYEFDGVVYLEVSANGGTAYTKIINGSILKDGFIPGNELRFRTTIAKDSVLKKITIGYTDSSGASTLYQNPDLKNYKYHKMIYITGGSEELFNYPLKIQGLSPQDLRGLSPQGTDPEVYFTAADGQTPLYYYYEGTRHKAQGTGSVDYWVRVPQIPKEGVMIYFYYGHEPGTMSHEPDKYLDPNKVFPFFEDFSGNNLDETKWQAQSGVKKEYAVKGGHLELKDGLVITRNFKMKQGILEFKAKAEENAGIQVIVRSKNTPRSLFPLEQIVYSSNYPGAEHTIAINGMAKLNIGKPIQPLTYYIYKATLNQTGIIFERCGENYEKQAEIRFLDMGNPDEGYIGLKADAAPFNAGSVYFDWLRVRPYIEVEPLAAQ